MDTVGDFLTIIRNANKAHKKSCTAQWSKIREGIAKILKDEGYVSEYEVRENNKGFKELELKLKYVQGAPAITAIKRESTPGRRVYYPYREIPRVLQGLGISILTTSKGILKDKEARQNKLGGELLCTVW